MIAGFHPIYDMKLPLVSRLISGRDSISFIREGGRILRLGGGGAKNNFLGQEI